MERVRTAVLISGRGSNLQSLIHARHEPDYPAEVVLVISNKADAGGLVIAEQAGIPAKVIPHKQFASREEFDAAVDAALREADVSLVCEAGFMRIHSEWFVKRWEGRILNIHPSLLPAFSGIHVHEQALAAGVKISGCTVHFLTAQLDSGPIIAQAAVPVLPDDTAETLAARVLEQEHKLYPEALRLVASRKVTLENGRAVFPLIRNRDP
ncbi:MAG: phosphoribosylglycinamide formyltransferase [Alphaproteobacteria bacterium]|nr:phosphoribosylglycinamide formyltransferase [Alphaproteobacteria bacterium]